ncbi:MAG: TetR/AcrR family transcriptional regulator, partial [Candidatus Thermoplasmatota archaeon]|nr:TetR/AcrR family transcriptional regulator [Candidatus Thermoplasmatota archaeon]
MARSVKKPGERRQEFIRAAETLFMEKGYQNTSVSHIVNRVGVAHGLFYYYFDSKEALLDVIVEDMLHQSEEELQRISRAPGTALEKLHQFMHYMFTMKKDKVYLVGYLQREKNVLLYHRWMKQAVHRLSPLLASIVQQGVEEGTFDAPHPGIAVTFLLT